MSTIGWIIVLVLLLIVFGFFSVNVF